MLKKKLIYKEYERRSGLHDRLRSVKFSRTIRNVSLAMAVVFFVEFFILLISAFMNNLPFNPRILFFPFLASAFAWLAWYFHGRFRSRE